jgi:hypothetical protein
MTIRFIVRERFQATNAPLEGTISHLYADKDGAPTIAVGVLCNTLASAQKLPLRRADGSPATPEEIAADWHAVNKNADAARLGHTHAAKLVKLHLSPADLNALVMKRFDEMVVQLLKRQPGMPTWPATAQMALCCWAWAPGAWSPAPRMDAALKALDFLEASKEVWLNETGNAGLHLRNVLNVALLRRAAKTAAAGGDYDSLATQPEDFEDAPPPVGMTDLERANAVAGLAAGLALGVERAIDMGREERDADV